MEKTKLSKDEDPVKIPKLINAISHLLNEIVKNNSKVEFNQSDPFSSKSMSKIPILYYIQRIKKYTKLENSTLIISLIIADKICAEGNIILTPFNIHRVFLASCLIAIKYNEDEYYTNNYYSQVGGIAVKQLNELEFRCVSLLKFNLYVSEKTFEKYVDYLSSYYSY